MTTRLEHGSAVFDLGCAMTGSEVTSREGRPFRFVAFEFAVSNSQSLVMLDLWDLSLELFWADGMYQLDRGYSPMDLIVKKAIQ